LIILVRFADEAGRYGHQKVVNGLSILKSCCAFLEENPSVSTVGR
jgi:hypothetical protein